MAKDAPEDIPPVAEIEARDEQERLATRDLLAGFDRPGRSLKAREAKRSGDFVAHYSFAPGANAANAANAAKPAPPPRERKREAPTFVLLKNTRSPAWPTRLAAAALTLAFGALIAFLALRASSAERADLESGPSATTTLSVTRSRREIPPPEAVPVTNASEQKIAISPQESAKTPKNNAETPASSSDDTYLRDF